MRTVVPQRIAILVVAFSCRRPSGRSPTEYGSFPMKCMRFAPISRRKRATARVAWLNTLMRISEIETAKTPDQQRLAQLKASSDRARNAVKQERQRQKIKKAQAALRAAMQPSLPTIKPIRPA